MTDIAQPQQKAPYKKPPGPYALPLVGALYTYLENPLDFALRQYKRFGEVVGVDIMGIRGVVLHGAEANRYILVDAVDNFLVAPLIDKVHARWIVGDGLLFIDDPRHKRERRLVLPAFHRKRIEEYQTIMRDTTREVLDTWRPGKVLDIAKEMHRLALIVVGRTLFDMELAGDAHELGDAVATVVATVGNPFNIALAQLPFDLAKVGRGGTLRKSLAKIDTILHGVIEQHKLSGKDTGDVVSMLVAARDEDGSQLTVQQIRDQLLTLFVAGHETSANALAWACYLLAQHPHVTTKLLAEIDRELAGKPPTSTDFERLPYLEQVVKEVLRIYPPAPSANRIARDAFQWKGYTVNKGDIVIYSPFITHRMEAYWREPDVFRPERFDPVNGDPITPYSYIPFSVGPRSCIGAPFATIEIKTVLAMILQRFRLDLVPGQHIDATVRTTVQPDKGILMRPYPQDGQVDRSPAPVTGNVLLATRRKP